MNPSAPERVRFPFAWKLTLAMGGLISLVATSALFLTRRVVEAQYISQMDRSFLELSNDFLTTRRERLTQITAEFARATTNPRLVAALKVGPSDQYERFYSDLAVELKDITRLLQPPEDSHLPQPFFRFIEFEAGYVPPPALPDYTLGLNTIWREEDLAAILAQVRPPGRFDEEEIPAGAGFLILPSPSGPALLEVSMVPVFDGQGYLLGDLVFFNPYLYRPPGQPGDPDTGIFLSGQWFGAPLPASTRDDLLARLAAATDPARQLPMFEFDFAGEPYALFNLRLPAFAGFPQAYQVTLFSLAGERRIIAEIRDTLLQITVFALLAGIASSLLLARRLTHRISNLMTATRAIASGDFQIRTSASGNDEIALLGRSFNTMAGDLELKEKYRSVLEKVTDRDVARQLTTGSLELGGEERRSSVLFCDIRSFTNLTERISAQQLVDLLNHHMTALTSIVHRHQGVVDKFVGDEIMVLFGAPRSYGNDAQMAVDCAQEMLRERARLNRAADIPIQIGIGLATGPIIAGLMGSKDRLNYTVIGSSVNLAARLCGRAAPGQLLFDANTRAALADPSRALPLEPMPLKGFAEPLPVFTLPLED